MNNLLKQQNIKLKLLNKRRGVIVESKYSDENKVLNTIALKLYSNEFDIILLKKSDTYTDKDFFNFANKIQQLCREFDATFIILGRVDIAFILNPDGIILSKTDIEYHLIKELLQPEVLLGEELIDEGGIKQDWSDFNLIRTKERLVIVLNQTKQINILSKF